MNVSAVRLNVSGYESVVPAAATAYKFHANRMDSMTHGRGNVLMVYFCMLDPMGNSVDYHLKQ